MKTLMLFAAIFSFSAFANPVTTVPTKLLCVEMSHTRHCTTSGCDLLPPVGHPTIGDVPLKNGTATFNYGFMMGGKNLELNASATYAGGRSSVTLSIYSDGLLVGTRSGTDSSSLDSSYVSPKDASGNYTSSFADFECELL